ncbi:MAG: hypothetical protein OXN95_14340, partial [bacterium]|nr:hypothetical protein [bacterium]
WTQRSNLLYCDKARLNTAKILAVWCPDKIIGSRWVPIRIAPREREREREKALSLYLNSTLGIVSAVASAAPNVLSRVNLSLDAIRSIPVPELTDQQARTLADAFDVYAEVELLTLADATTDGVRIALDESVALALKIPLDTIAQARSELSREPSVQG